MRKEMRDTLKLLEAEGFTIDSIRTTNGAHKVVYATAANGGKHVFTLIQTYGDPRATKNLVSLARRRAKETA